MAKKLERELKPLEFKTRLVTNLARENGIEYYQDENLVFAQEIAETLNPLLTKIGLEPVTPKFVNRKSKSQEINVNLEFKQPKPNSTKITFSGKVVDENNLPLAQVQIIESRSNPEDAFMTDSEGNFSFAGEPNPTDNYSLSFSKNEYNTKYLSFSKENIATAKNLAIRLEKTEVAELPSQDPLLDQQEKEAEDLYKNTLATLQKTEIAECKDLAQKNIDALENYMGNFGLLPIQAQEANREEKNIQAISDLKAKTTAWIKAVEDCKKSTTTPPIPSTTPIPEMIVVQGGTFNMGCTPEQEADCNDDEKPLRENVAVKAFSIGKYEITNEEFAYFLSDNGAGNSEEDGGTAWLKIDGSSVGIEDLANNQFKAKEGMEKRPVTYVSWDGAKAYCNWLSKKTEKRFRLPTEVEWEYAARGGRKTQNSKYSGSDIIDEVAWYRSNSDRRTHSIEETNQKLKANELGIYNMSGNVWEWIEDCWHENYTNAPTNQEPWLEANEGDCSRRVLRGGSWNNNNNNCVYLPYSLLLSLL